MRCFYRKCQTSFNGKCSMIKTTWETAQKMKFSNKDFFSKCDQTRSLLLIWSQLLKKSLMENFIFLCSAISKCTVRYLFTPVNNRSISGRRYRNLVECKVPKKNNLLRLVAPRKQSPRGAL